MYYKHCRRYTYRSTYPKLSKIFLKCAAITKITHILVGGVHEGISEVIVVDLDSDHAGRRLPVALALEDGVRCHHLKKSGN